MVSGGGGRFTGVELMREPMKRDTRFAAVILNWNGWQDTVECLESLQRSDPAPSVVIVCDNASSDGSVDRIRDWAAGRVSALSSVEHPLRRLVWPPVEKPIELLELDRVCAEEGSGGSRDREAGTPIVLIQTGANLGYAGGLNVGLRYLHRIGLPEAVWILNPDTVVEPNAGGALFDRLVRDPSIGICGSTVRYHDRPGLNQVLGGATHHWWLALSRHIGENSPAGISPDEAAVTARMNYVYGASMMITRRFIETVGLMDEEYFLYFEELDLAMRGRRHGFGLGYAPESVVYHRWGQSTGVEAERSEVAEYYFHRNRIRVTRKFRPVALPGVYAALLVAALRRAGRGEWNRMRTVTRLMLEA